MLALPRQAKTAGAAATQSTPGGARIPRIWDDAAMADLELPLSNPIWSPKHISADYYYRIPVRPIYKQYPVYAPGHEPPGYLDWLKQQDPRIIWDDKGHAPPLQTEADWISAGELVFGTQIFFPETGGVAFEDVRNAAWYEKGGVPVAADGTLPFVNYVIRQKGKIELGSFSCAMCHTRVMPGGAILKGAQGNFPLERAAAHSAAPVPLPPLAHSIRRAIWAVPWLHPDPLDQLDSMPPDQIAAMNEAIPGGVLSRHRASPFYPPHIPDLIGVKDRRYLDATGLQQQRSIVDIMRYSALNQGADFLANFNGFIPADMPNFKTLPDPADPIKVIPRYSDQQLYALALHVYSLKAPANPNKFDAVAQRGRGIFERNGCPTCHTPPLYTSNKLTLAEGFSAPPGAAQKYDILAVSVGTDSNLTLRTRRGTGYYKVPSLQGVWYRGMFGHSGWCATLEDWFDRRRLRDDYVPTGFKPYGSKTYAVKGHLFGLDLSAEDRKALIAFLKTL